MLKSDPFTHLLDDPWAPHPVVNRHICSGGGDDGGDIQTPNAPSAPDYTAYIKRMTEIGEQGLGWAKDFMTQAQTWGVDVMGLAKQVAGKAGAAADAQQATSDRLQKQWETLSGPMYEAQQREAMRMIGDLPAYQEQVAGADSASAAQAIDQQKAALQRKMLAEGTTGGKPGIASQALDTQAAIGRATATTAAAAAGRERAKTEAWGRVGEALKAEEFIPGVASEQGKLAIANRGMEGELPQKAAAVASGLYAPAIQMYGQSIAPMKEWGHTMMADYDARLKSYGIDVNKFGEQNKAAADSGGSIFETIIPAAAGIAGSYFGSPAGGAAASKAAGAATSGLFKSARGGKIPPMGRRVPRYAQGGAIDLQPPMDDGGSWEAPQEDSHYVDPSLSPSGGEVTDDVPAMVNAGEFVIPERTVDWYGEQYFQKLIMKADKEREQQTVAAPEEVDMEDRPQEQALQMNAPMFRSEGARV